MGFGVQGLGFRVWGLWFSNCGRFHCCSKPSALGAARQERDGNLAFRVQRLGFRLEGLRVGGVGLWVQRSGLRESTHYRIGGS